ncbi:nucleotidyl transferase AbiEii/AbiGii toxin family protein [Candidatus Woesearchaeota archaeon]|nr:nucleotidyl transferase AbiEii/AbiGii toxin family protein [Candidatus Woesearchaeota archaeon]
MISKQQLQAIALQSGLNLYQQEKDYLLKLFLFYYYKHYDDAVFKGGTYLKYLFSLERFSEDLDFNCKKITIFQHQIKKVLKDIEQLGIQSYFIKEETFADAYTCEIGFYGPLYQGTNQTQNKFRIDAGYRTGTLVKPEWKLLASEYPETQQQFLVLGMTLEEALVEKMIALFSRKKGRDLYDMWFLMQAKVVFDKQLFQKKLKKEKIKIDVRNIVSKKEYERDMSKLTSRMIDYEQIVKEINIFLKKNKYN